MANSHEGGITKDDVVAAYESGMSKRRIYARFGKGFSPTAVDKILAAHGVTIRPVGRYVTPVPPDVAAAMAADYAEGLSVRDVAAKHGRTYRKVHEVLSAKGVLRPSPASRERM